MQLPDRLIHLLQQSFPAFSLADCWPTQGGFSNLTIELRHAATHALVKAATIPAKRADLRNEWLVLRMLDGQQGKSARPLFIKEDSAWTVVGQEWLPGVPGLQLLDSPVAIRIHLYAALGVALAQVHALEASQFPAYASLPTQQERAQATLAALEQLPVPPAQHRALHTALARSAQPCQPLRLVHGDPGAHNVLWANHLANLIDWEWAGWGEPIADLAWVRWTLWFRQQPAEVETALLQAYPGLALKPREQHQLALARMAQIMVRVASQPDALAEWQRRLDRSMAEWKG